MTTSKMNSPRPYFGGKSRLASTIIDRIPKHKTYAEVFGGAAWVLFKKEPGSLEALNDLDRNLMNFYRVVKHHLEALVEEVAALQPGRGLFHLLREELDRPALTDIQRAAAYYYLQRQAFAGRPGKPTLAIHPCRPLSCRQGRGQASFTPGGRTLEGGHVGKSALGALHQTLRLSGHLLFR